jgi:succinate dehydrogenase / fumarate reductase flavoprotein subunit
LQELRKRSQRCGITGNIEYNPGWHTALDLDTLLTVAEAITRSALERKESRGAQFREDYPNKDATFGTLNVALSKQADGSMLVSRVAIPQMRPELVQVIEEMK